MNSDIDFLNRYFFSPCHLGQHGHEKDITTGFEYINEERLDQPNSQVGCEMKLLSSTQLQESPFTHLARFVAEKRQVRSFIPTVLSITEMRLQISIY